METLHDENKARASARDAPEHDAGIERLLDLLGEFARTKLSLNSLVLRPVWRETMRQELQAVGINQPEGQNEDQLMQWLPIFYRLGRELLGQPGGLPMRTIAEALGVPVSTATRFVEGLVQRGLLERHTDAQDRRLVLVQVTPQGQQAHAVIDQGIRGMLTQQLSQFSPEERTQLLNLGQRLLTLWRESLEQVPHEKEPLPQERKEKPEKPKEKKVST